MHRLLHPLLRGYVVSDSARLMRQWFIKRMNPTTHSMQEWFILSSLSVDQGRSPDFLAAALETDTAAIAKLVESLAGQGFVQIRPESPGAYYLTAAAKPLLEKINAARTELLQKGFAGVSKDDQDVFQRVLVAFHKNLQALASH